MGLAKTCDKLGIAVWAKLAEVPSAQADGIPDEGYLGSRLKVAGRIVIQSLDRYVRGRFRVA